jgi:Cd2+/Zn2+-exporting ATPase
MLDKSTAFVKLKHIDTAADRECAACGHDHSHTGHEDGAEFDLKKELITLVPGCIIYASALLIGFPSWWEFILYLVSYIIIGRDVVLTAAKNMLRGRVFDEFFLMTVATIGAFAINEYPEAVAVMLFFKVGELFQDIALNRSRRSIKSLMEIRPDYANVQVDGEISKVDPNTVSIGDAILIKPGERVPLDGMVSNGSSMVDTSALTGESVPRNVKAGDEILSGMINKSGLLTVRATKKFSESTVSKILDLVEHASEKKAPTEKFITKFAKYYTPIVVFGAVAMAVVPVILYNIPIFTQMFAHQETFTEWIYKALIFLVISCPCALVISIPLGFFGGIGAASKQGVLVKGSNFLEGLNNLRTVVWDKTGTLTKGVFRVTSVNPRNGFSRGEVLQFAAQAESHSTHPIAQSIREAFSGTIDESAIGTYEEISGHGVKATVKGAEVLAGNDKLLHQEEIAHDTCSVKGTVVHVAIGGTYAGYLIISDEVKPDARAAVQRLKNIGVKKQIMLTGDNRKVAKSVAGNLGLDAFFAELLPQEKVAAVEGLMAQNTGESGLTAFVGDGINDAPVIIRSDIGIAMGALGSDAAIDAADIVLMSDEPSRIPEATNVAKRTRAIVWQNIIFALGVKGIFLALGAFGVATMWEAVFADVGVALLAILNASRVLKGKKLMV